MLECVLQCDVPLKPLHRDVLQPVATPLHCLKHYTPHAAICCNMLQHAATRFNLPNTVQHAATHSNTLQQTLEHYARP